MKVPLPNLDDRRWSDLVDEARSLIPLFAPDWTDHNIHDPGITLFELFAWIAEMDIYELNRITDRHKRKFLALVGITPRPPLPARTVLAFHLRDNAPVRHLNAQAELAGKDPLGEPTRFRLIEPVTIVGGDLAAIQVKEAKGFRDLTARYRRGESLSLFGDVPALGNEFYLGFTKAFPRNQRVSIYFAFEGSRSGEDERLALISEDEQQHASCPHASDCKTEGAPASQTTANPSRTVPRLNRTRITWEALAESGGSTGWLPFDGSRSEIEDQTRSLTLDGRIVFTSRGQMVARELGQVQTPLHYIRCRLEAGAFDAPPVASELIFNAAAAEQAVPVWTRWIIEPGVVAQGPVPRPGDRTNFILGLDERRHITALRFEPPGEQAEGFLILDYRNATSTSAGTMVAMVDLPGLGTGRPNQELELSESQVQVASFKLYTEENNRWRRWTRVDDFVESTRRDAHFVLDPTLGKVTFGDGEKGRVPPEGAKVFAAYRWTRAEEAAIPAGTGFQLDDSRRNRILINDFDAIRADIQSITNRSASAGEAAESLDHAIGRAIELVNSTTRAVTLADYEELAMKTPGTRIARATARANLHPSFPCFRAPGLVTLIVVPDQPGPRPTPAAGLLQDVAGYLHPRRVIGTRVEVVGPRYLDVVVRATVQSLPNVSRANLAQQIVTALNNFFDPLKGGPEATGWPFGRDVFRSEVMQTIDEIAGVDHVVELELIAEGCAPQCGNICLAPAWLVASGAHEIEVM